MAIPADRIAVRGDNAILLGLSEDDIKAMPEYKASGELELAAGDTVQIGRYK